jgi:hypothetical protein
VGKILVFEGDVVGMNSAVNLVTGHKRFRHFRPWGGDTKAEFGGFCRPDR